MAAEFLSLIFYRVCNPKSEEIAEARAEAERKRFEAERKRFEAELQRLRTISEAEELRLKTQLKNVEAKRKWFEEEVNRLRRILENKSGPEFCLPSDLLVVILSRLDLKDNIRSCAVCKTWGEIAASVRVRDPPCWLMSLDPCRKSYWFFDPVEKKKTKAMMMMDLPESCYICYSNDGWLLMRGGGKVSPVRLFFFNPFTRERIDLPLYQSVVLFQVCFGFSCAPTKKQGCVVFGITKSTVSHREVEISTWHPGAATWVKDYFPNPFPCDLVDTINVSYARDDGLFYISLGNALGVFDPSARTWNLVPVQPIPRFQRYTLRWMTEYKGEIFLVDASSSPVVYRLNNRSNKKSVWEKKETLDACSIFVSDGSCVMTCGSMSNILYFWNNDINDRRPSPTKYHDYTFKKNRPYKYSLYSRSLCEDPEGYYFEYRPTNPNDGGVWIQPPHDISIFDFPILPADAINTRLFI